MYFYVHTGITYVEMSHGGQYNAEARDPVIVYSWCVFKCRVLISTVYVHGLQTTKNACRTEK
jgi:hypothetical protein